MAKLTGAGFAEGVYETFECEMGSRDISDRFIERGVVAKRTDFDEGDSRPGVPRYAYRRTRP
jgi:hypothetical protein